MLSLDDALGVNKLVNAFISQKPNNHQETRLHRSKAVIA
jgi:hypothetical protein